VYFKKLLRHIIILLIETLGNAHRCSEAAAG
jgi:hypothetical protein